MYTHTIQSPYCAGNYLSMVWPCECPVINFKSICIVTISLLICPWFTQHAIWHNACHKEIGQTGWDLNPRPSAYKHNALTDWANLGVDNLAGLNGVFYIMHPRRHVRFMCIHVRYRDLITWATNMVSPWYDMHIMLYINTRIHVRTRTYVHIQSQLFTQIRRY
jgi:hypothetical protein